MRDWTRAVVFRWAGSGSCGVATGAILSGDPIRKRHGLQTGCLQARWWGDSHQHKPSHPSVRQYDRSEPMRLTNLWCREEAGPKAPFGTSGSAVQAPARGGRAGPGPRAGAMIGKSAPGAPQGDHTHTTIAPFRRPQPLKGPQLNQQPGVARRAGYLCRRS